MKWIAQNDDHRRGSWKIVYRFVVTAALIFYEASLGLRAIAIVVRLLAVDRHTIGHTQAREEARREDGVVARTDRHRIDASSESATDAQRVLDQPCWGLYRARDATVRCVADSRTDCRRGLRQW
jgi:hypothetical protein